MKVLVELLPVIRSLGKREAILYSNGFRTWRWSYEDLHRHVAGVVRSLEERGIGKGDRVLLWGESRPEWVAAFWACLARGVVAVPVDFRSTPALARRIQEEVRASLLVHGAYVDADPLGIPTLTYEAIGDLTHDGLIELNGAPSVSPDDTVQVLYTSGTTGDPKGVVHRHRNLCAVLSPIGDEIRKYAAYARPFQPIRFLDLLPLSHVFGQFMGLYIPLLLGGSVVFIDEIYPHTILETIHRERVSVLVSVPRFLHSLRRELERRFQLPERLDTGGGLRRELRRWWRFRNVHSAFGWKFWAVLVGGAQLPAEQESFFRGLGWVVAQGYGLTEASAMVTANHPFHTKPGSLGKALAGQEIKLAADGEILVRGENVVTEYYRGDPPAPKDTWLRTGDIGELDDEGHLFYRGRKKDVIVGADGLNVFPSDIESTLNREPAVKESVVVGRSGEHGETVHAVLLLANAQVDANDIVQKANNALEPHQRIREWSVWPDLDFPRTSSTLKVRRHEVAAWVVNRATDLSGAERPGSVRALLERHLTRRAGKLGASDRLAEDLGLTSLDRVELLTDLEQQTGARLDETKLSQLATVEELEQWVEQQASGPAGPAGSERREAPEGASEARSLFSGLPRWTRTFPIRAVRTVFRELAWLPLFRYYIQTEVIGPLERLDGPVLFAANHTSHLDVAAILAALPFQLRDRVAPAMGLEHFPAYLKGATGPRASEALKYWMVSTALHTYPLPQTAQGAREALQFSGHLVDSGYSPLVFPEGRRTPDGRLLPFQPGVGLMAVRLQVPVVPIYIKGLFEVMSLHDDWPIPGPIVVHIGDPVRFEETGDYVGAARRIEEEVRGLARRASGWE